MYFKFLTFDFLLQFFFLKIVWFENLVLILMTGHTGFTKDIIIGATLQNADAKRVNSARPSF